MRRVFKMALKRRTGRLNGASLVLLCALAWTVPAFAVNPDEMLKDPAQEYRARELGKDLRCLVCQNQSIDDSDADLAKDLRIIVRERISAGDSDAAVKKFVVDRYGDYVLLKPPFKATTLALWLGPFALFAGAVAVVLGFYRRRRSAAPVPPPPLSADEKKRLEKLLKETGR
ncbi:Cytochrome c-type biogenesis protein CcmH [Candidatus Terasakiella magnetica]|nr:Cytochrome c-type biogenesis protein CcmH [Candidatus Terasakiella magnetica]